MLKLRIINHRSSVETIREIISVLSLFTIVSFKNEACVASGAGTNGTCYSSNECIKLGGNSAGTCASGFGVCCLCKLEDLHVIIPCFNIFVKVTSTCDDTTSVNGTYFQNPGYSSTYNR